MTPIPTDFNPARSTVELVTRKLRVMAARH
jgi:hypothetical protein